MSMSVKRLKGNIMFTILYAYFLLISIHFAFSCNNCKCCNTSCGQKGIVKPEESNENSTNSSVLNFSLPKGIDLKELDIDKIDNSVKNIEKGNSVSDSNSLMKTKSSSSYNSNNNDETSILNLSCIEEINGVENETDEDKKSYEEILFGLHKESRYDKDDGYIDPSNEKNDQEMIINPINDHDSVNKPEIKDQEKQIINKSNTNSMLVNEPIIYNLDDLISDIKEDDTKMIRQINKEKSISNKEVEAYADYQDKLRKENIRLNKSDDAGKMINDDAFIEMFGIDIPIGIEQEEEFKKSDNVSTSDNKLSYTQEQKYNTLLEDFKKKIKYMNEERSRRRKIISDLKYYKETENMLRGIESKKEGEKERGNKEFKKIPGGLLEDQKYKPEIQNKKNKAVEINKKKGGNRIKGVEKIESLEDKSNAKKQIKKELEEQKHHEERIKHLRCNNQLEDFCYNMYDDMDDDSIINNEEEYKDFESFSIINNNDYGYNDLTVKINYTDDKNKKTITEECLPITTIGSYQDYYNSKDFCYNYEINEDVYRIYKNCLKNYIQDTIKTKGFENLYNYLIFIGKTVITSKKKGEENTKYYLCVIPNVYKREFGYDYIFNKMKYKEIVVLDSGKLKDIEHMFSSCENLEYIDLEHINVDTESTSFLFYNCKDLKEISIYSNLLKKVKNMSYMFASCESLEEVHIPLDSKNIENMTGMFSDCKNLRVIDIDGDADFCNVNNMKCMFYNCVNLNFLSINIKEDMPFSNTNIKDMFKNCYKLSSIEIKKNKYLNEDENENKEISNVAFAENVIIGNLNEKYFEISEDERLNKSCNFGSKYSIGIEDLNDDVFNESEIL